MRTKPLALAILATMLAAGCSNQTQASADSAAAAASAQAVAAAQPAASAAATTLPDPAQTQAIAEAGFLYGLPIVMNYGTQYEFAVDKSSSQYKAPFNQLTNEHRVFTWKDTSVVTANSDTPYSILFADLRAEPLVFTVPAVPAPRYYSIQLVDGNTFNYGYIGSRATGTEPGSYLIAGPNWNGPTPPGIKQVFHSTTEFSMVIGRTQLFDPADMPNVEKVQAGYKVQPLSAFLGQPAPAAAPAVDWPAFSKDKAKTNFFGYLDFLLQFAPPGPEETDVRAQLARIGVGSGHFDMASLPKAQQEAIVAGMQAGEQKLKAFAAGNLTRINGWTVTSMFGDRAFFHGDWLLRAAAAITGIYGNDAVEAMYSTTRTLPDDTPIDTSKHDYTLTFAKGALPPVKSFWSITMYDGKSQLLIKNPINRYLINSPMLPHMQRNADGSLTIYIQKDSPGKAKEANWLPAPDAPAYLAMRLYWPDPASDPSSILPPGKGTWQPPAIEVADHR